MSTSYQGDFSQNDLVAPEEKKMWGVHTVTVIGHWLEEHAIAIGAILMLVAIVAMSSDAMTNNGLLGRNSKAPFIVAIITAIAAESSGRALLRRCQKTWATNKLGSIVYGIFGLAIVAVIFQTVWMWMTMMTENITEAQALYNINIDARLWTFERALVFSTLFALHAFIGYKPPQARKKSRDEQIREMRDELAVNPLKAQLAQSRADLAARVANAGKNAIKNAWTGGSMQPDVVVTGVTDLGGGDDEPTPPRGPRGRRRGGSTGEISSYDNYPVESGELSGALNMTTLRRRDAAATNWILEHSGTLPTREELRQCFIEAGIPVPSTPATYDAIISRASANVPMIHTASVSRAG